MYFVVVPARRFEDVRCLINSYACAALAFLDSVPAIGVSIRDVRGQQLYVNENCIQLEVRFRVTRFWNPNFTNFEMVKSELQLFGDIVSDQKFVCA